VNCKAGILHNHEFSKKENPRYLIQNTGGCYTRSCRKNPWDQFRCRWNIHFAGEC